eukprot:scaffold3066_cov178-Amphora_coffeaeformis.AAC.4
MAPAYNRVSYTLSTWSRGMIPASGAGGPGFDSRSGPKLLSDTRIFVRWEYLSSTKICYYIAVSGTIQYSVRDFWNEFNRFFFPPCFCCGGGVLCVNDNNMSTARAQFWLWRAV